MSDMLRIYHMGSGNESLFGLIGQSPEQQRDVRLPEGWNAVMEDGRMMVAAPHCGVKWDLEDCLHAEEGEPVDREQHPRISSTKSARQGDPGEKAYQAEPPGSAFTGRIR